MVVSTKAFIIVFTLLNLNLLMDEVGESPFIIIIIYYKIVHEVHDRRKYSKNNKNSKREH